jgi:RNA polymerase sigma-70 factor (ECF subfamily)
VLDAIARGDGAAFRGLYERTERRLHRLAYATLLDEAEASEAVQEAFVRLHREARRLPADTRVEAWLWRVTLNAALSWRRRWVRFGRPWAPPRRLGVNPEQQVGAREGMRVLEAGMRALPPKQRAVAALHLDEGLEPAAIAPLLELTPNATRVTLHRALQALRERLTAAGIDPTTLNEPGAQATSEGVEP